jgi:hypothetical protein
LEASHETAVIGVVPMLTLTGFREAKTENRKARKKKEKRKKFAFFPSIRCQNKDKMMKRNFSNVSIRFRFVFHFMGCLLISFVLHFTVFSSQPKIRK